MLAAGVLSAASKDHCGAMVLLWAFHLALLSSSLSCRFPLRMGGALFAFAPALTTRALAARCVWLAGSVALSVCVVVRQGGGPHSFGQFHGSGIRVILV